MIKLHPQREDCRVSKRIFYLRDALPDSIELRLCIDETSSERLGADSLPLISGLLCDLIQLASLFEPDLLLALGLLRCGSVRACRRNVLVCDARDELPKGKVESVLELAPSAQLLGPEIVKFLLRFEKTFA